MVIISSGRKSQVTFDPNDRSEQFLLHFMKVCDIQFHWADTEELVDYLHIYIIFSTWKP